VQEAMQKAFGALDGFDETRPFAPWLKRIAVDRRHEGNRLALMPSITIVAFVPLGYVLRLRNL
jgi:hypothetical protein